MSWTQDWVMHNRPCPPPPAVSEFSCETHKLLWEECLRYEQECYRIRQKHYKKIDEIVDGASGREVESK